MVFAPQKGADADEVAELTQRLRGVADIYRRELGVDVTRLPRAGAAGGLAGGLAARGALLCDGFATIAGAAGFDDALASAGIVVTGEGFFDRTSFAGKVVGGVLDGARTAGVEAAVVAGDASPEHRAHVAVVSLVERFGAERAWNDAGGCVADAVELLLRARR